MTTISRVVLPFEEQLKAELYTTLRRLGLSRGLYMNWNYAPIYPPGCYTKFVGDTRWNL